MRYISLLSSVIIILSCNAPFNHKEAARPIHLSNESLNQFQTLSDNLLLDIDTIKSVLPKTNYGENHLSTHPTFLFKVNTTKYHNLLDSLTAKKLIMGNIHINTNDSSITYLIKEQSEINSSNWNKSHFHNLTYNSTKANQENNCEIKIDSLINNKFRYTYNFCLTGH